MAYDSLMEKEANLFAMELLMPEKFLKEDIGVDGVDLFDDASIKKLAKKYRVTAAIMSARLAYLHLNTQESEA